MDATRLDELDTPWVTVDLYVFEANGEPGLRELGVGDRVRLIPSHIDSTINLHEVMYAHRDGRIEATWAIAARGKVQ